MSTFELVSLLVLAANIAYLVFACRVYRKWAG